MGLIRRMWLFVDGSEPGGERGKRGVDGEGGGDVFMMFTMRWVWLWMVG